MLLYVLAYYSVEDRILGLKLLGPVVEGELLDGAALPADK